MIPLLLCEKNILWSFVKNKERNIKYEIREMIDDLMSDKIIKKVGGRFKLTALVQRRLEELLQGARPLIEDSGDKTMLEIAIQEISQDKITIDTGINIQAAEKTEKN